MTERIGLIATGSTTFDAPYHIARRFASLDHLSNGRAGWNIVTTSNPDAALNFGLTEHVEHGERYRRAREFYDVVTGLWDSLADDAFLRDVDSGIYFDPEKLHVLNHKGPHFSVRGPLNVARPIQGWPVIVQAGASEAGKQLAAETAEAVFAGVRTLQDWQALYRDIKGRMEKLGRSRDDVLAFADATDRLVTDAIQHGPFDQTRAAAHGTEGLYTALEHEAMHQETLLYMWHRLDYGAKHAPRGYAPLVDGVSPGRKMIGIPEGAATLGADRGEIPFGWDNEFSKMIVTQRAYAANARVITTADDMLQEVINIKR